MARSALVRALSRLKAGEHVVFSTANDQSEIVVKATKTSPLGAVEAYGEVRAESVVGSAVADVVISQIVDLCVKTVRRDAKLTDFERRAEDGTTLR